MRVGGILRAGGVTAAAIGLVAALATPASAISISHAEGNFNPNTDLARICDNSADSLRNAKIEWLTGAAENYHSLGVNGGCNSEDHAYVQGARIKWRVCAGYRESGTWSYSCTAYQLDWSTS